MKGPLPRSGRLASLGRGFAESLETTWTLLSETGLYLSRSGLLPQYETQIKSWRDALASKRSDKAAIGRMRAEIVQLRKILRAEGHDLYLGGMSVTFEGFRDDSCLGDGFRRLVIVISGDILLHVSGEDNHVTLAGFLQDRFARLDIPREREFHYLWYRRKGKRLRISGSDTETKEDFFRLEALYAARPLILLAGLKDLR